MVLLFIYRAMLGAGGGREMISEDHAAVLLLNFSHDCIMIVEPQCC